MPRKKETKAPENVEVKMPEKNEPKKSNKIALIILTALIVLGCIVNLVDVARTQNVASIVMFVYYAFIIFYATYGYKIPHGNLLKVVVLSFSFALFVKCFSAANTIVVNNIFNGIAIIMIAFMSGRLDRLKQNNIIAVVVLVCLLVPSVLSLVDAKEPVAADNLQIVEIAPTEDGEEQAQPAQNPGQPMQPMQNPGQPMQPAQNPGQPMQPVTNPGQQTPPAIDADQQMQPVVDAEPSALVSFIMEASNYSSALLWVVIVSAYNIRYLTHKEAGLKDE